MATFWRLLLLLVTLIVGLEPLAALPVSIRERFSQCQGVPVPNECSVFFVSPPISGTRTCCNFISPHTDCLCALYNNRAILGYDVDKACSSSPGVVKARCSKVAERAKKAPQEGSKVTTPRVTQPGPCERVFVKVFVDKLFTFQWEDFKNCGQKINMVTKPRETQPTSKPSLCGSLFGQLIVSKLFKIQVQVENAKMCGQKIDKVTTPRETQPGTCEKLFGLVISNQLLNIQLQDIKNCVQKIDNLKL
ncbi:hypothetical protein ACP70R_037444 [Stipagrostis hirtigluma subsp. patula]